MTKRIFEIRSEHQSRALPPCCTDTSGAGSVPHGEVPHDPHQ
jgi:hypothetical protein